MMICEICGHDGFRFQAVLGDKLADSWGLSDAERQQVNRQQGECCTRCGANLRSIALAGALRRAHGWQGWLRETNLESLALRVLEINEAGQLSPQLERIPGHRLMSYPDIDMQRLPDETDSLDLVIHSDTLEHIEDPLVGMRECSRVLRPGGVCCFTVPLLVKRLGRSRRGLAASYHDNSEDGADDQLVHTEFGADAWTLVLEAGFDSVELFSVAFPCAIAITARKRQVSSN